MAYSKIILNGETLMDVTSDTVAAGSLLSGKTATKNDGTKVTGNIANKTASDLTASGATVTAAAGYYSSAVSKTVILTNHPNPTATIASSTGVVTASHTQGTGYVTGGTTTGTLNLTTQGATTYNTSTADQTIASYRWLTGTQTIKSVTTTNLTAANIASGVVVKVGDANNASRITQVTGTYAPAVSSVTVTPTETTQTFNATGVYGYKPVTVNGISSTYVGTGIARKSSADVAFASATATFTAPIGYYSAAATKTLTTQAAQTIYPSTADQTVASYRWLTGTQTIKSVVTSNLTAENIAEGVVIKIGDANNASRITQVTGTHSGATSYTATISGTGDQFDCYVKYKSYSYYNNGESFTFEPGDTLEAETTNFHFYVNNIPVIEKNAQTGNYTLNLPPSDITIEMNYSSALGDNDIKINTPYVDSVLYAPAAIYCEGYYQYGAPVMTNAISGFSSFLNALDFIPRYCFFGRGFQSGTYTFTNASTVSFLAFGGPSYSVDMPIMGNGDVILSFPNCVSIGAEAFLYRSWMTNVSFPICTQIGSYAFSSCRVLQEAYFPLCSQVGEYAFTACYGLLSVHFPTLSSVREGVFANCETLVNVSLPSCTFIGNSAFRMCRSLPTISLPQCTTVYSFAFMNCIKLSTINLPKCERIYNSAFYSCSAIETINLPLVSQVSNNAFGYCTTLEEVNLPNVQQFSGYVFTNCYSLRCVSVPICSIFSSYVFMKCYNLISLYLTGVSSIPTFGNYMFSSTPISNYSTSAGRYGSIFVPSSLYTAFTTATGWTAYSARMVSV